MPAIQPDILTWARETAGLSLEDAARAIGLREARGRTAADRLANLENGTEEPPRALLVKMAHAYKRSLLVFYLAAPPKAGDRGKDFRTLPGPERFNPDLDALIRDIDARQDLVRSMLQDSETPAVNFVSRATIETPVHDLAKQIADNLGFSLQRFRAAAKVDGAFGYLRDTIERAGIFVLLLGNLGSHHTNIPVEIFRGFALADHLAPMIVINDQDTRTAWSFTALHELVHLWLGDTGVSGSDATSKIERYCNDVAGEILLPATELTSFPNNLMVHRALRVISEFAQERMVSRAMVAYKLLRAGLITKSTWTELTDEFNKEWQATKQQKADKPKIPDGGPSYYVVRRHRVGAALLGLVRRSLDDGIITYTKAGRVLGVKPRNVEPLLQIGSRGTR